MHIVVIITYIHALKEYNIGTYSYQCNMWYAVTVYSVGRWFLDKFVG